MPDFFFQDQATGMFVREYSNHYNSIIWTAYPNSAFMESREELLDHHVNTIRKIEKSNKFPIVVWKRDSIPFKIV